MDLAFDHSRIEETIDAIVTRTMRMDMTWDWPCGVAYYGVCRAYEATGQQKYLDMVRARVGKTLPEAYLYPRFMDVQGSLSELLPSLKLCQTENGLWRTILDDPGSYEEISASCGIAAAMIDNGNPLHTKYVQRAIEGVLENVSTEGRVLNVSGGTAVMRDREGYRNISRDWIQGWGQGLALAFLSGVLGCGEAPEKK